MNCAKAKSAVEQVKCGLVEAQDTGSADENQPNGTRNHHIAAYQHRRLCLGQARQADQAVVERAAEAKTWATAATVT
jgi:hypothetical protein